MSGNNILVGIAQQTHIKYIQTIVKEIESSANIRGTGINKRSPEFLEKKILESEAIIAIGSNDEWVGFGYLQNWENEKFVSHCALIVSPAFRGTGVAREIKTKLVELSRLKYPNAKIFGLTTSLAVMKINSDLGFKPVTYSEVTNDDRFWSACKSCPNYSILSSKEKKNCLCTAMLFQENLHANLEERK